MGDGGVGTEWVVVFLVAIVALVLGVYGFQQIDTDQDLYDGLYRALQLFTLESGAVTSSPGLALQVARFLAPAVGTYAVVRAAYAVLRDRVRAARVRRFSGHFVVCGLSSEGIAFVRALTARGDRVVVVEPVAEHELSETCHQLGAWLVFGDATDPVILASAGAHRAASVITTFGDDTVNAEVALQLRVLHDERRMGSLRCLAHFVDPEICLLLRASQLVRPDDSFELDVFNVHETAAAGMIASSDLVRSNASGPRVAVLGLGSLGKAMLTALVRFGRESTESTKVVAIGENATEYVSGMTTSVNTTMTFEAVDQAASRPDSGWLDYALRCDVAFVCYEDPALALEAVIRMGQGSPRPNQVVVGYPGSTSLAELFEVEGESQGIRVSAFDVTGDTCTVEMADFGSVEAIARAGHGLYVQHQQAIGVTELENPNVRPWEELSDDSRHSNYAAARDLGPKLKAIGCSIVPLGAGGGTRFSLDAGEVEVLARMEHIRWMRDRLNEGWELGPRDDAGRMHPDLVEWELLDEEAKDKDRLFVQGIPDLLGRAGYQIVRLPAFDR